MNNFDHSSTINIFNSDCDYNLYSLRILWYTRALDNFVSPMFLHDQGRWWKISIILMATHYRTA